MHNGEAIELLYELSDLPGMWKVKLLFVEPKEKYVRINPHDSLKSLHTKARTANTV